MRADFGSPEFYRDRKMEKLQGEAFTEGQELLEEDLSGNLSQLQIHDEGNKLIYRNITVFSNLLS